MYKKLISIFVAVMMVLSIIPAAAFASDGNRRAERPNTAASLMPRESTRDAANLDEALNVAGGNLVFTSEGDYPWVVEGDAAKSSNAGVASSTSAVSTTATAAEGDIVQFDFKAWGEGSYTFWDKCEFAIDGSVVFSKGAYANEEWEAFATELTPGSHTLTWSYTKDSSVNPTGDYFAVDNVYVGQPVMAETINVEPVSVPAGRTARVAYEVLPAAAYDKSVTFSTADAAIATVNAAGVVTGVAEGTTTITVTSAAVPTVSGTATITVTEALPAVNIEGFATYDLASSGLANNWVGFADYDPSTVSVLAPFDQQAWAGAFAGGNVYGYVYSDSGSGHNFYIMDTETYTVSFPGNNADAVGGVIGMAYNHANQTMYGLSTNSGLVTVDLATGVPTPVASVNVPNAVYLLAIDQQGNAYTMDSNGGLYALDLTNGNGALIGNTGLSNSYVQSMTYDFATDMIYWAQLLDASNHGLYAINPQTAAAESLGMIGPGGVELTSMYIKNDLPIDDIEVPDVTVTFIDGIDNAVLGTQIVEAGTVLDESTFPTAPTHEGYEFTGWDYNGAPVWSDLTVKAKYRDPNATTATVVLNVPQDVWGDGSGYQMLIDADATAYGTIIPETGALTAGGDAPAGIYDQFEYKIPVNADGSCSTQNIIVTGEIAIEIPAGTYDWCITNPTPGDRIWIASSNGNIPGRYDDFEFEGGYTYTFTVTLGGNNDQVNLEVESGTPVDPTPTPDDPTPVPVTPEPVTPEPGEPGEEVLVAGYYFEDGNDGWTFNGTADTNWVHSNDNPGGYDYSPFAHEGSGFIMSYSFVDYVGSFQADNWAISPAVTLPTGSARVSFYATNANVAYPEAFDVYIGTSADTSAMTLLQSNISPNSGYDAPWTQYEIDLSDYAGQTIYLAFHDHCYDAYEIWIDQVEFFGEGGQTPVDPTEPPVDPTEPPVQHDLDEALNVEGGELHFESEGDYPWTAVEEGDRIYAMNGNTGVSSSDSILTTTITANAGDVVTFEFKAWGEGTNTYWDYCEFAIDGERVGYWGAYQNDWEAFISEPLTAGEHTLTWKYHKDGSVNPNGDYFMVDNVEITEGELPPSGIIGDVDMDGNVDTADALLALRYVLELESLNEDQLAQAEVDGDGEVTIVDALLILRVALGILDGFPTEG